MLRTPAPFPYPGSFALLIDKELPVERQRAELARVIRIDSGDVTNWASIALPLRVGASGNRVVPLGDLIDATPLTRAEDVELRALQMAVRSRVRPNKAKLSRVEALRQRAIFSVLLASELAVMNSNEARSDRRQGASPGRLVPDEAEGMAA